MDSTNKTASDVPETDITAELELKQQCIEHVDGKDESTVAPKDVSDSSKKTDEVCEPTKEMVSTSQTEGTPKKTIEVKAAIPPGSQSITIIMSPSSSSQKTQTVRLVNPEQMSSMSMQTIQLPFKTSPIVLKATTIPMPTKTVSIIAKPSTSASPTKVTSTVVLPSTSKTPTKSSTVRKGVVGVGKGEASSKSEAALHQMVRPGGVTKAKMQSARVIVVPLQITKEMIAAKQKAAGKTSKLGATVAGKSELGSKAGTVSVGESGDTIKKFIKGKTLVKPLKKDMTFKRKEEGISEIKAMGLKPKTYLKVASKSKKATAFESDSESENLDLESMPTGKSSKLKQDNKKTAQAERDEDEVESDEDQKEGKEDESKDSEAEQGGKTKVSKVKKVSRKKDVDSEESDDAVGKHKTKQPSKDKNDEDMESETEIETKSKAVSSKSKTPKKGGKKSEKEDEEQNLEADSKSRVSSAKGKKAKAESHVKDELDAEVKEDHDAEDKQAAEAATEPGSEDLDLTPVKSGGSTKKKKMAKEEEGELHTADSESDEDEKSESELAKVKKTPGRKRKEKTKEEPVVVTSTRRSKRESNLSVKLAEWGLVPMATPKSHSKPAVSKTPAIKSPVATKTPAASKAEVPRSPVASKSAAASKVSAGTARSPVAARSPSVAAVSPMTSFENVSPPVSPGKQHQQQLSQTGVTVTVVKDDTSTEPPEETSQESSASAAPVKSSTDKPVTKSGAEWIAKASSILSSGTPKVVQKAVPKATPKSTPKAAKVDKSTTVQPVKQVIKVPEKVIVPKTVEVKQMQNKSLMCKPIMMTKATSCNPIRINKDTQTDGSDEGRKKKTMFVPVPVPFILPAPVATCALPAPFPVPLPVPLPVPCFIPSTRKSIDSLMKSLQELHDQMPSDPFEADLLAMAEAVTTAHNEVPDCIMEPEDIKPIMRSDPSIGVAATTMQQQHQSSGGDSSEDMLELALRMATEMPEEGSLEIEAVRERMASHPEASQTTEFGTILQNGSTKRSSSASDDERNLNKKARLEVFAGSHNVSGSAVAFATALTICESHMKLKYSYGVKAWKYWVSEKNAELEKAPSASKGRSKLFKQEILQCGTDELNLALSLFVKEVRKPTGEEYAPDSIYYLCLGIQHYLYENGRIDNIFTDFYYKGFTDALNAQLSGFQVCLNTQGMIVCRVTEEQLWESRQLGAHSPHVLLNTLIYFNTKHFQLNSDEMHMTLSFANIMKQFKKNIASSDAKQGRTVYLRYNPTTVYTGTDGARRRLAVPPVNPSEQLENSDNPLRCPVKLYEFYLSKCPETIRNRNDLFYLTPEVSCVPDSPVWYSTVPLSMEVTSKMLNRILVVREIQEACLHLQPVFG